VEIESLTVEVECRGCNEELESRSRELGAEHGKYESGSRELAAEDGKHESESRVLGAKNR
jgi:hypothetical protein